MSQSKHTPGPWKFVLGDICGPDDEDGDDTVLAAIGTSYGLRSSSYTTIKRGPEMEANARLITAAPELRAALEPFEELFRDFVGTVGEEWFDRFAKATADARAALSKAEGQP